MQVGLEPPPPAQCRFIALLGKIDPVTPWYSWISGAMGAKPTPVEDKAKATIIAGIIGTCVKL